VELIKMSEMENRYTAPIEIKNEEKVSPFTATLSSGKKVKFYVDKVGYKWEFDGRSGLAEKVRIQLGTIDHNGDVSGKKKSLNLPSDMSEEDLKQLFTNILSVKDKELQS
jgi:hypothetical protein